MDIKNIIVALIGVFAVLAVILTFADLDGGEWEAVAQNVAPLTIAFVVFIIVIGGIAYWRTK
jgi:hypothetical protein